MSVPLTELLFSFPGRIFRSPMPFGPYDLHGEVYDRWLGLSGAEALQWVRRFIPRTVETPEQQGWYSMTMGDTYASDLGPCVYANW
jgi:hypothetical protein